jgi:hypothetical protein
VDEKPASTSAAIQSLLGTDFSEQGIEYPSLEAMTEVLVRRIDLKNDG